MCSGDTERRAPGIADPVSALAACHATGNSGGRVNRAASRQQLQHRQQLGEPVVAPSQRRGRPVGVKREPATGLARFAAMRAAFGSQALLAEVVTNYGAPTHQTTISRYEAGKCKPGRARLRVMAEVLRVGIGVLEDCLFSDEAKRPVLVKGSHGA